MRVFPYGDRAAYVDLEADDAPKTHAFARFVRAKLPGADVVVGAGSVVIAGVSPWDDLEPLLAEAMRAPPLGSSQARLRIVHAIYDGPDLAEIAAHLGVSVSRVAELHAQREYLVELVGFLPGFAYLGSVDPALRFPRRPSPRPRVDALSIGVAGTFTGIYPFTSPGGWNLIGRARDIVAFDPGADPPLLLLPGDRVKFVVDDVA